MWCVNASWDDEVSHTNLVHYDLDLVLELSCPVHISYIL